MATRQGYLWKRTASGNNAPAVQRVFCVLAGTTLWDFDTEEEAALGLRPRCEIDVIGVSPWDGKARYQNYAFGFLFLSSLGTTYHAVAQSKEDLESWLSAMRVGLQAKFGMTLAAPKSSTSPTPDGQQPQQQLSSSSSSSLSPPKAFDPPRKRDADVCGISGQPLGRSNPKCFCLSCGGSFGQEYCCEDIPLLHYKLQQGARVCRNCFLAQYFLNHLKLLNATLRTYLHELEQEGRQVTDKNSARIRVFRSQSKEALLAWQLYDNNQIDAKEFTELLKADARLKDERENSLLAEFQSDIERVIGEDAITLLRYLFDLRDEGQPLKYAKLLQRLLDIAEHNLPAVDFILPQLLQIFILMSDRGLNQVLQLEALEEFIVQICTKSSTQIPLRVVWSMMGYYEDTLQLNAPSTLLSRRGRIIRLTLHVEAAVRGTVSDANQDILSIFTIPSSAQLALIRREWSMVQECRRHPLLRPFPPMTSFRKMHGSLDDDDEDDVDESQPLPSPITTPLKGREGGQLLAGATGGGKSYPISPSEGGIEGKRALSFAVQMKFVKELTDTAESLRYIDMSLRRETLRASLQRVQNEYHGVFFPISRDYGTMPRIIRVCVDEGAVFRSKARVPVLICFEVIIGNMIGAKKLPRRRTSSLDYMSEEEVEHLIDKGAFHERMNSLGLDPTSLPRVKEAVAGGRDNATQALASSLSNASITVDMTTSPSQEICTVEVSISSSSSSSSHHRPLSTKSVVATNGQESSQFAYASKAEVFRMVRSRRKKASGALRASESLGADTSNSSGASAGGNGATTTSSLRGGGDDNLNMAKLIRQYEESCTLDDSQAAKYISPAVATAIEEFKKGNLSEAELEMLVGNDQKFQRNIQENSYLDVQFFVSMAFGESWAAKKARIKAASPDGNRPGWDLLSMIVKSNDDLRQEVCMVQLIELCRDIFLDAGLELWLEPYGIISTTSSTGLIETLTDALSLDALKKKDGYISLSHHFDISYGHDKARLTQAKRAFITSLAAYSLVCYVFQIKDRHNGNILLDTEGHMVHIDYGFILGIAPGGSFSIETAPFKLTTEMVDVMGGVDSPLFDEFITHFACGFFALQANIERIIALVEIMAEQSRYPCFVGSDKAVIIQRLRARMYPGRPPSSKGETLAYALDLITQSYNSLTTKNYDLFQYYSNGVYV